MKRTQSGELKRWKQPEVTVHIDSSVDAVGPGAREAVIRAWGGWLSTEAQLPRVTFDSAEGTIPGSSPDGLNTVVLAPIEVPGHRTDMAITLSYWDSQTGEILEADIIINSRYRLAVLGEEADSDTEPWRLQSHQAAAPPPSSSCGGLGRAGEECGNAYDLQNLLSHEVGHFFGLGEDYEDPEATMFNCTSACETLKRSPTDSDAGTLSEVYAHGFEEPVEAQCSVGRVGSGRRERGLAWTGLGLLALAAAARRRRARARADQPGSS